MTDLEMTKLCAEAMGIELDIVDEQRADVIHVRPGVYAPGWVIYDPLYNDAQVMALVKRFQLFLAYQPNMGQWWVRNRGFTLEAYADDLNRAIVECVAKMQDSLNAAVSEGEKK